MEPSPEVRPVQTELDGASKKNDVGKCKHFSMRKYVSEMRQKDAGKGWPFKLDYILSEVPKEVLPSLDVPEYRWWNCRYCLPEFWVKTSDTENSCVKDTSCIKCKLGGSFANAVILGETATLASDCQLTLNLDMAVAEKSSFKISAEISVNRCNAAVLSVADRRDGTIHDRSEIVEDVYGKDVEGETDGKSATRGSDFKESPALCCNGNGNLATENAEKTVEADKQAIDGKVTKECEHEKVGLLDRFVGHGKGPAPKELDERDSPSFKRTEVGPHKSGSSHRRKSRKVRLLTDLLASVEETSNNHIRKDNAPLLAMCDASRELRKQAGAEGEMADFGNAKKFVLKKIRKLTPEDSIKSSKHVRKNQEKDNPSVITGTAKNGNADLDSQTDDDELTEMFSRTSLKGHLPEHVAMRKKKKKNQVIGHSSEKKAISSEIEHTSTSSDSNEFANGAMGTTLSPSHGTSKNISFFKEKNNLPPMRADQINALPPDPSSCSGHPFASTDKNVRENLLASAQYWSEKPPSAANGTHLGSKIGSNLAPGFDKFISQMMRGPSFHGTGDVFREGNTARNNTESSTMQVDPSFPSRHASNAFRFNGVNGIVRDGNNYRIPFLSERQRYSPNMVDQSCFWTPNLGISGASKKKKVNKHREHAPVVQQCCKKSADPGNPDDIPMEIVELMAKHQYERYQQDAEMDKISISRAKSVCGSEATQIAKEESRRKQNLWLNGISQKREFHPQNGYTIMTSKDVGSSAQKCFDMSSDVSSSGYNVNQMERYHIPPVHHTFFNDQRMSPHNFLFVGGPCNLRNTRCNGMNEDCSRNKVLDGNFLDLGVSGIWYAPKHNEELGPRHSSVRPDSIPVVYSMMPQSCGLYSNSINFQPHFPRTPKVEMNCTRDPRLFTSRANGLHRSEKDLNFVAHRGANLKNPLISRLNSVEHEGHSVASLDISSDEAIPAMHLLSLMDAGMHSGKKMKMDENTRISEQPSLPCQSHAKEVCGLHLGLCKTCIPLRRPPFDYDHQAKVFSGKYQEHSAVPAFGLSASASEPANVFTPGSVGNPRVPLDVKKKGTGKCNEAGTSGFSSFLAGNIGLGTSYGGFKPCHNMERNFPNSSETRVISPYQRMSEIQTIEAPNDIRTTPHPPRNNPDGAICTVNRNPAEFSVPEEGNVYSIGRDDLKLVKRVRNKPDFPNARRHGGKKMAKPKHAAGTSQNQLQIA